MISRHIFSIGRLDRYAARCANSVLVLARIAVPGAESAPERIEANRDRWVDEWTRIVLR